MPTNQGMDEQIWSIHTMAYYSAMKRNEVLTPVIAQMNLINVLLNERSQSQKPHIAGFNFYEMSKMVNP